MVTIAILGTIVTGLMAGTMYAYAIAVLPGISRLGPREFVAAFTAIDAALERARFLLPVFLAAPFLAGVSAGVAWPGPSGFAFGVAFVCLALTAFVTIIVHRPLNRALKGTRRARPEEGRAALNEERWNAWHGVRVALTIVATGAMAAGLVLWP